MRIFKCLLSNLTLTLRLSCLIFTSAVLTSAAPALATDYTWTGGGFPSNWFDTDNWTPTGVPDSTSVVTFPNGAGAVAIDNVGATDFQTKSITIDTTHSLDISRSTSLTELYINNGDLTRTSTSAGNHTIGIPVYISGNGNWTINGSGSLAVGSINETSAGLNFTKNGTGTLSINTGTYTGLTNVNVGTLLVGSSGLGAGAVSVSSGATLGPSSGSTVNHAISINGTGVGGIGALNSPSGTTTWSGGITLSTNSSIGVTSGTFTISGLIDDGTLTRTLTKVGAGTLVLSHANTYKGATTVSAGILTLNNAQAAGNTDITVASGASLVPGTGLTITNDVFLNGSGVSGGGALHNDAGKATWDGNIALQSNVTLGAASDELLITGSIGGGFNLTKVGAGTVTLAASNGFGGTLTVSEGTLKVRHPSAPAASGTIVTAGATLAVAETIANAAITVSRPVSLNGNGVSAAGALRNVSSNNTWSGSIALQSNSSVGVDADQLTISGIILGGFNLSKVGTGTLALTNPGNAYNNTVINGGFLLVSNAAALPAAGNVVVHDGGTLRLQNGISAARSLFLNGVGQGGAGAVDSVSGANQWTSPIVLQSDSAISVDADELRISASIGGVGALTKIGAGKLSLLSSDTFAGSTEVNSGVLGVEHSNAIPPGTTATVAAGAAIELRGGIAPGNSLALFGSGILKGGALRNVAGNNIWAGPITLKSSDAAIGADAATQLNISGIISDDVSSFALTKVGSGPVILSNANTYKGGTIIDAGILSISADNNLGLATAPLTTNNGGKLLVTASTTTGRTFNLNTGTLQVSTAATLTYTNAIVNGGFLRGAGTHAIGAGSAFNGVIALNGTNITQSSPTTLVNFTNGGSLTSNAALTWDGGFNTSAGVINVNNTFNTQAFENDGVITVFSGGTITNTASPLVSGGGGRITINSGGVINAGSSFELNGSLLVNNGTITGATNVNFGSVAKGSGIYGAVNVTDGGKFSPGNSPGSVTTGSTTWNSGGSYVVEIGQGTQDFWQINGRLVSNSSAAHPFIIALESLDDLIFDKSREYSWPIVSARDGIDFGIDRLGLDLSGFKCDYGAGQFSLQSTGNELLVHFSAVPEPAAVLLLVTIGFSSLLVRRRVC